MIRRQSTQRQDLPNSLQKMATGPPDETSAGQSVRPKSILKKPTSGSQTFPRNAKSRGEWARPLLIPTKVKSDPSSSNIYNERPQAGSCGYWYAAVC